MLKSLLGSHKDSNDEDIAGRVEEPSVGVETLCDSLHTTRRFFYLNNLYWGMNQIETKHKLISALNLRLDD